MASRVLSIEIGYSLTRVCEVSYNTKTPKVFKSFTVQTVEGVMNDGVIQVDSHYVQALNDAVREHKIKAKKVIFSITSTKIASREVTIPYVKENRIRDVVKANASEYFPVDLSQYELAYSILETMGEKGSQQYKLLVLAAPSGMLKGYYDLAAAMRMEVASIDYVGNSLYQVVKGECATGTHLIAKMDERSTLIMVVKDSNIAFTRNVSYGVEEALQAVMESVAWGNIRSLRQAVGIVEKFQCIELKEDNGEESAAATSLSVEEAAQRNVTDALVPLVNGIVRVIDYYASRNQGETIDDVLLTGMGANFLGMDKLLNREINYPVRFIKKVSGLNLEKFFKEGFFGEYLACIGASMESVDFRRSEDTKSGGKAKGKAEAKEAGAKAGGGNKGIVIASLFLVAGLLVGGGLAGYSLYEYMQANNTNVALNHKVKELMPVMEIYNNYLDVQAQYDIAESMYEATESQNDALYEFFVELEQKLPADVSVVSFNCTRTQVTISMKVSTKSEAAATVEQMRTFQSLIPESVTVAAITETESDEDNGSTIVEFSVTALYAPLIKGDAQTAESVTE